MKKSRLAVLLVAAVAVISMGCGKEEVQTEEPVQAEATEEEGVESYDSLADWYTAEQIDFSQMEETLNETITGYGAMVAVEGDTLIYRFMAEEQIDVSDTAAIEAEAAKMEAYCSENEELFMEFTQQVMEESGVETTMSLVEVMDAASENLIYMRNF